MTDNKNSLTDQRRATSFAARAIVTVVVGGFAAAAATATVIDLISLTH